MNMHNPDLETVLEKYFNPIDSQQITSFLKRGFSEQGEISIVGIFICAHGVHKKPVREILAACEEQWQRIWGTEDPEERGDPNASGGLRTQNLVSLMLICQKLKIPNPGMSDINDLVEMM